MHISDFSEGDIVVLDTSGLGTHIFLFRGISPRQEPRAEFLCAIKPNGIKLLSPNELTIIKNGEQASIQTQYLSPFTLRKANNLEKYSFFLEAKKYGLAYDRHLLRMRFPFGFDIN